MEQFKDNIRAPKTRSIPSAEPHILSHDDTKMLKAIAVLMMLFLHMFNRYDYQGNFKPWLFVFGHPLSFYLAKWE